MEAESSLLFSLPSPDRVQVDSQPLNIRCSTDQNRRRKHETGERDASGEIPARRYRATASSPAAGTAERLAAAGSMDSEAPHG
jgi:hypothetical protein